MQSAIRPSIARIVAWDAFLSRPALIRRAWTTSAAANSRAPSFDDAEPKRQKQAYFKPGKAAAAGKSVPADKPGRLAPAGKPSSGTPETQRLAKVFPPCTAWVIDW